MAIRRGALTASAVLPVGGPAGGPGPASTLGIGTVAAGDAAQATITGTAPNQTLSLVLPRGATGPAASSAPVAWTTGMICVASAPATAVIYGGESYVCIVSHLAGGFSSDLAAGRWIRTAAKGVDGAPGAPGTNGNTVLYGNGAPAAGSGSNGDFYVDTLNSRVYGPKTAGSWPAGYVSLIGPQGTPGTNGTNGSNGINGAAWYSGAGAPGTVAGAVNGDWYINTTSGDLYRLISSAWTLQINITAVSGAVHYDTAQSLGLPAQLVSRQNIGARGAGVLVKSAAYTLTAAHAGQLHACTGAWALTLPAASAIGNGFAVEIRNEGTGQIPLTPNGSDTINGGTGGAAVPIYGGESCTLYCDGTGWRTFGLQQVVIAETLTTTGGYRKWSRGLIHNWGKYSGSTQDPTITFLAPHTSEPAVFCTVKIPAGGSDMESVQAQQIYPTGFVAGMRFGTSGSVGSAVYPFSWESIGP